MNVFYVLGTVLGKQKSSCPLGVYMLLGETCNEHIKNKHNKWDKDKSCGENLAT